MTKEEVIDFLKSEKEATRKLASTCNSDKIDYFKKHEEAYDIAIKSLEAWEKVENICTIQVADTFRNFEEYDRGSHAREKIRNTCSEITILLKAVSE